MERQTHCRIHAPADPRGAAYRWSFVAPGELVSFGNPLRCAKKNYEPGMARRCHDGVSLGSENRQVLSNGDEWALLGFNSSRPLCRSRLSYIAARCFSREGATSRESVP